MGNCNVYPKAYNQEDAIETTIKNKEDDVVKDVGNKTQKQNK